MNEKLALVRKALVGFIIPAVVVLGEGLADGALTVGEALTALGAALGTGTVVWRIRNAEPVPDALVEDEDAPQDELE